MIATLLLAQATTPMVTITPPPQPFDLAKVKTRTECRDIDFAAVQAEVIVCATRPKSPPPVSPGQFAEKPLRPEVDVLGGKLDVAAEQKSTLMGTAPAAMARFKLKF